MSSLVQTPPARRRAARALLWAPPLAAAGAVALGALVALAPRASVALALVPVALLALYDARARVLIVVFGGMLVLNSSTGFDYEKLLYLGLLALSVGSAWRSCLRGSRSAEQIAVRRRIGAASLAMGAVAGISAPVALLNGNAPTLWLRDVAPYLMLGAMPILALDGSLQVGRRMLTATFIVAGLLGAASMAIDLVATRGIFALPVERLALDRLLLPTCLFAFACAQALRGEGSRLRRYAWAVLASALIGLILLSGSRVGLLLLAAPVAILLAAGGIRGAGRGLAFAAVGVFLVALIFEVSKDLGFATDVVMDRLRSTEQALRSPRSDYSLVDRFAQVQVSWQTFMNSPFLGVGPGHLFVWDTGYGVFRRAFTIDASTSTLAKFGLVGTAGILAFFFLIARLVRSMAPPVERTAFIGLAAITIPYLALSNPLDDKGFGFGLLFLLALALGRAGPPADR